MKNILKKFSFKNSVKLIICIVAFSACVGCADDLVISQRVYYYDYSGDNYDVSTYIGTNNGLGSYDRTMHRQNETCNIKQLDSVKKMQLIRAEQIKDELEKVLKH